VVARDLGIFDAREEERPDTLSQFEHWWSKPVQGVLFAFGFANAGVPFSQIGPGTYYVLIGLLVGKPVGVVLFSSLARVFGARLPTGLRLPDLLLVGMTASIGFTVSLFFAAAAFPGGPALAETKMGALLSFVAAPIALLAARAIRTSRQAGVVAQP
jgi:NhaA family Na+:H+ antiporter